MRKFYTIRKKDLDWRYEAELIQSNFFHLIDYYIRKYLFSLNKEMI